MHWHGEATERVHGGVRSAACTTTANSGATMCTARFTGVARLDKYQSFIGFWGSSDVSFSINLGGTFLIEQGSTARS